MILLFWTCTGIPYWAMNEYYNPLSNVSEKKNNSLATISPCNCSTSSSQATSEEILRYQRTTIIIQYCCIISLVTKVKPNCIPTHIHETNTMYEYRFISPTYIPISPVHSPCNPVCVILSAITGLHVVANLPTYSSPYSLSLQK